MSEIKCNKCNKYFSSKQMLLKHENRKNRCDEPTDYKCKICNRYFKQKKNLLEHVEKKVCVNNCIEIVSRKEQNTEISDKDISDILENKSSHENKVFLIKLLGVDITDDELNKLIESSINISTKINLIKNKIKVKPNINNINSNNTTNNIQINNFGSENIEYLTPTYFKKLLTTHYGQDSFLKLSNEIYLNDKYPENNTIKVDNLNNKYCKIKKNNKWITTTKDDALKRIFDKVADEILKNSDDFADSISEQRLASIIQYFEKDYDEEIIKDAIKKFIIDIYNYTLNDV